MPDLNRKLNVKKIPIWTLISFIIVIGFWSLNSLIIIFVPFLIILINRKEISFSLTLLDIAILGLLLCDSICYYNSYYKQNSFSYFSTSYVIVILYFINKKYLNAYKNIFSITLLIYGSVIAVITILFFFNYQSNLNSNGFFTLNNFKHLYTPFGFLNNDWVSVFILFLPFSLILLLQKKVNKIYTFISLALILFCIIVSFSRGAYISLISFFLFFIILTFKIINKKQLLSYVAIFIIGIGIISFPVKNDFLSTVSFNELTSQKRSTSGRISNWKHLKNNIIDFPILGWGQDNLSFAIQKRPFYNNEIDFTSRVNNTYIKTFIEKGVLGMLSYLLLFLIIIFIFIKNVKEKSRGKKQKLELIIILSGMLAFAVRELTFSSFSNNSVYFLFFHLLFFLIPFDTKIKEFKFGGKAKNILLIFFILFSCALLFFNFKQLLMNSYNNKFISQYQNNEILKSSESLNKALNLSPDQITLLKQNVLLFSKKAFDIEISNNYSSLLNFKRVNIDSINYLIRKSKEILKINPYDDEVNNNLGWLNFSIKNDDKAEFYFKKSIEINPNNTLYHASKLLLDLKQLNNSSIENHLEKILFFSPDFLDSELYEKLVYLYPDMVSKARINTITHLEKILSQKESPIMASRLGRLLLDSDPKRSLILFENVTEELPNMNRPWMYRAMLLEKFDQNKDSIVNFYKHAIFLDPLDFFPKLKLGEFYETENEIKKSVKLYKEALTSYNYIASPSYKKNKTLTNLNSVRNSSIPSELLLYVKPKIDALKLFIFIENYYQKLEDKKGIKKYNALIEKYNNQTYLGS